MTCPACNRDNVALIGGFCGMCSSKMVGSMSDALDDLDLDIEFEMVDIAIHSDGYVHVRMDYK